MTKYKDDALAILKDLPEDFHGVQQARAAEAQVYATLHLAEQQRIANLLAYLDNQKFIPMTPENEKISDWIREGLGL